MGSSVNFNLYKEVTLRVEVLRADAFVMHSDQCWVVELMVSAQGMSICGHAFLSSWWKELLFERVQTCPPPHFISGEPITNTVDNDLITDLAEHVGEDATVIGKKLINIIDGLMFGFSGLSLCGSDYSTARAKHICHHGAVQQI